MKELDCVEIMVEKEKYAREGVHQGMQGWICDASKKTTHGLSISLNVEKTQTLQHFL